MSVTSTRKESLNHINLKHYKLSRRRKTNSVLPCQRIKIPRGKYLLNVFLLKQERTRLYLLTPFSLSLLIYWKKYLSKSKSSNCFMSCFTRKNASFNTFSRNNKEVLSRCESNSFYEERFSRISFHRFLRYFLTLCRCIRSQPFLMCRSHRGYQNPSLRFSAVIHPSKRPGAP